MEPKITGKRIKMRAWKIAIHFVDYSDSKTYDVENFINNDADQRFANYFATKNVHSERGFI